MIFQRPRYRKERFCSKSCNISYINTLRKGELSTKWKGGKFVDGGYLYIQLDANNPFISMATKGYYVLQHRLVMAEYLGRPLLKSEIVHHINKDVSDNRIENLLLLSRSAHQSIHVKEPGRKFHGAYLRKAS